MIEGPTSILGGHRQVRPRPAAGWRPMTLAARASSCTPCAEAVDTPSGAAEHLGLVGKKVASVAERSHHDVEGDLLNIDDERARRIRDGGRHADSRHELALHLGQPGEPSRYKGRPIG